MVRLVRNTPFTYKNDIFSGIIVAFASIVLSIVLAQIIGVDFRFSVLSIVVASLLSFAFGGRDGMFSAPSLLILIIAAPIVAKYGFQYLSMIMVFSGVFQLAFAVLRFGKYVRLIPRYVILGIMTGLSLITLFEFSKMLRISAPNGYFEFMQGWNMVFALLAIVLSGLAIYYIPKYFKALPVSLVVIVGFSILFFLFNPPLESIIEFDARFMKSEKSFSGFYLIDFVPLSYDAAIIILPYSLFFGLIGILQSLGLLSFVDEITNTRGKSNAEIISLGIGNIVAGLIGGLPLGGSPSLTITNLHAGGKGRISYISAALAMVIMVFVFPVVLNFIPAFVLIGIMVFLLAETFIRSSFYEFQRIRFLNALLIVTVATVFVFFGIVNAAIVGVIFSFVVFAWENARRIRVRKRIDDTGTKYYEVYGPLFFGSIPIFKQKFDPQDDPNTVVFDFYESKVLDYEGATGLFEIINEYKKYGKTVKLKYISSDLKRLITKEKIEVEIIDSEDDPIYTILIDELSS